MVAGCVESRRAALDVSRLGAIVKPKRDAEFVERLFERTHEALWRFALRMGGNADTARDLVQDTFLRALQHRLPADERAAEAWLYRTLVNRARDLQRRQRVRRAVPPTAHAAVSIGRTPDPESAVLSKEHLGRAIAKLPPRRRAILLLHELEGHTVESIATTFQLRVATVRWHLAQAKRRLRRTLDDGPRKESENER
jgi:RNA polymerase sigma-70 factor (ECF subfamily)